MGIAVFPAASAGGIKSVQRGSAGSAGNVTITAVDITKAFVNVFGTTSSGVVSASFGLSTNQNNSHNFISSPYMGVSSGNSSSNQMMLTNGGTSLGVGMGNYTGNFQGMSSTDAFRVLGSNVNGTSSVSHTVNAGSNNLVAAVVQGFLANGTTLTVSGACRWEVVEFN
jgi:hypothetical protein